MSGVVAYKKETKKVYHIHSSIVLNKYLDINEKGKE